MVEVVINRCFGGFSLSFEALQTYVEKKGKKLYIKPNYTGCYTEPNFDDDSYISGYDIERTDPDLISTVKELGSKANGTYASLDIVEIPDDVEWYIHDYYGSESVHENHRIW